MNRAELKKKAKESLKGKYGNAVGIIIRIAGRSIADGILAVILVRFGIESLKTLDQGNDLITGLQFVGSMGSRNPRSQGADQKNCRKHKRNQSSFHISILLLQ